ncbi:hypothetical protein EC968_000219 [Mortierella alpina]|nr:hypothetical protein EC968_000219 [Mortierella alpina]
MSTHSGSSSHISGPPSGNAAAAPPTLSTLATGGGTSNPVQLEAAAPAEAALKRRRRRSTNYLPPINPITMMEEDNMDDEQRLGATVLEQSVSEDLQQRTLSVSDPQESSDATSKRVRRSGLRQPKAASIAPASATVTRKRASAAKPSTLSSLSSSTLIASTTTTTTAPATTLTASSSSTSTLIAPILTAPTLTASTSTASTSTASTSTAATTPKATTKRKKRERPVASHPYILDPLVSISERVETNSDPQRFGSPSSPRVPHSGSKSRRSSFARQQGLAQRRANRAEHAVHLANPDNASNAGEVQSEEAAVHALMHMQHDRYQRAGTESYSPLQDARQPYSHQHQHQNEQQYQHEHQYQDGQMQVQHHTLHCSQPHRTICRQECSSDNLTHPYRHSDGRQPPQDSHWEAHGNASRHHYTSEAFNGSVFRTIHDQDMYAAHQEPSTPEMRGYQTHQQHPGPVNFQYSGHHTQSSTPMEMHLQHGHYPTRTLNIPPQVIDRTLRLHQAFYDWGFSEGFASVLDQTIHDDDQQGDQRQAEYQRRWEMYERGLQVGIALAKEQQQQQQQDDPAHWDPTYPSPTQGQPLQYITPAPLSPQPIRKDAAPVILPALPAGGPLPRVPLGQVTLPTLQMQSVLPESLDQDWFVLPKIIAYPPTTPPLGDAAGTEMQGGRAGRAMLAAAPSSTSTPSMLESSSKAASSASTCSPPSAPDTPRR